MGLAHVQSHKRYIDSQQCVVEPLMLKKIKAWVLFYFTKTLGGGPTFED